MAESRTQSFYNITPFQQIISSCTGALITSVFVTPLDVVKIRLQAQQKAKLSNKCFLYCNGFVEELCCNFHAGGSSAVSSPYWYRPPGHLTGTLDAFVKITRAEGVTSLWSGLPPTLLMAVPATVVYFTMYDQLRQLVLKKYHFDHQPLWLPAVAGGMARAIAATLISPLELVRTKMQSQKLSYLEIRQALKNLVLTQGLHSMWRGLGPTILRDVPFSSLYWLSYEFLKQKFHQQQPTFWFSFGAGATAGSFAALLTLPFDVVKTHRQIELGEMEALYSKQRTSTYSLLRNLYQSSGYRALFTGVVPRIVKVAPACAIMISSYEYSKRFFHNYNNSRTLYNSL
ncbi:probable mitochondrial glutathione transporter SLC25A40 [Uloborus diversus]|uniref:probable mitochondrial glutathione transporter SLC25A40 n=1 Tax=Uloborus diversus TaxID=327109 RepID=UPI002408F459|nr:probable mitochondrial glutathione transporter SLC25A40 [Uloborus diversus]